VLRRFGVKGVFLFFDEANAETVTDAASVPLKIIRGGKGILRRLAKPGQGERRGFMGQVAYETLMRPRDAARRLAVSRSTIYRWFWEGKLKGVKITGGTVRILESAVEQILAGGDGNGGKRQGRAG
jgi:excisionase family DNA binding protein